MNQRTAKLLNRYASEVGLNYKQLRREWEELNQKERAGRRRMYLAKVNQENKTEE